MLSLTTDVKEEASLISVASIIAGVVVVICIHIIGSILLSSGFDPVDVLVLLVSSPVLFFLVPISVFFLLRIYMHENEIGTSIRKIYAFIIVIFTISITAVLFDYIITVFFPSLPESFSKALEAFATPEDAISTEEFEYASNLPNTLQLGPLNLIAVFFGSFISLFIYFRKSE